MRKMAARIPSIVRGRGFHDSVTGRVARNRAKFRASQLLRTKKSKYTSGTPTVSSTEIKNLGTGKSGRTSPRTIPPMRKEAAEYFAKTAATPRQTALLALGKRVMPKQNPRAFKGSRVFGGQEAGLKVPGKKGLRGTGRATLIPPMAKKG